MVVSPKKHGKKVNVKKIQELIPLAGLKKRNCVTREGVKFQFYGQISIIPKPE